MASSAKQAAEHLFSNRSEHLGKIIKSRGWDINNIVAVFSALGWCWAAKLALDEYVTLLDVLGVFVQVFSMQVAFQLFGAAALLGIAFEIGLGWLFGGTLVYLQHCNNK